MATLTAAQIKVFDQLLKEAEEQAFEGWDFSYLRGRWETDSLTWDYRAIVENHLPPANALLDMGTGGGEFLSSLSPLPPRTSATEAYPPNIKAAREQLEPLGVVVKVVEDDEKLPFEDDKFDLVINRHEAYSVTEILRILEPMGVFITQQVGDSDSRELNEGLGIDDGQNLGEWSMHSATQALAEAGFNVLQNAEAMPQTRFFDVGAIVYYAKIIEWQFLGFSIDTHRPQLLKIHEHILEHGAWTMTSHRFLITAQKPKH